MDFIILGVWLKWMSTEGVLGVSWHFSGIWKCRVGLYIYVLYIMSLVALRDDPSYAFKKLNSCFKNNENNMLYLLSLVVKESGTICVVGYQWSTLTSSCDRKPCEMDLFYVQLGARLYENQTWALTFQHCVYLGKLIRKMRNCLLLEFKSLKS